MVGIGAGCSSVTPVILPTPGGGSGGRAVQSQCPDAPSTVATIASAPAARSPVRAATHTGPVVLLAER